MVQVEKAAFKRRDLLGDNMMKKNFSGILLMLIMAIFLSGCSTIGSKTANMSVIYLVTSIVSLLLLIAYFIFIEKKEIWFSLLFISVFIVNTGYFLLSVSETLEKALVSNRIAYLGSAFLPLSMLMTIINVSRLNYRKWVPAVLLGITLIALFIAASPGYSDIYYKSVTLEVINGVSFLKKEYGAWHTFYLYYLVLYFALMIAITIYAAAKRNIKSGIQSAIILVSVFVNLCVWLLGQLIDMNFEFLSVSYIISELFLISVYLMVQNVESRLNAVSKSSAVSEDSPTGKETISEMYMEKCRYLKKNVSTLTPTEKVIYNFYLSGKSTKEIMKELKITENTLKFHNKNIYSKLGVTSRKQLLEYVNILKSI